MSAEVDAHVAALPEGRRVPMAAVVDAVRANIPAGYEEVLREGMITWEVPLSTCPDTYNGQPLGLVALASQKAYMSLYLMGVYGSDEERDWFVEAWTATGRRLDMGRSCVRFKKLDDVPLDVLGQAVARVPVERFVAMAEAARRR